MAIPREKLRSRFQVRTIRAYVSRGVVRSGPVGGCLCAFGCQVCRAYRKASRRVLSLARSILQPGLWPSMECHGGGAEAGYCSGADGRCSKTEYEDGSVLLSLRVV